MRILVLACMLVTTTALARDVSVHVRGSRLTMVTPYCTLRADANGRDVYNTFWSVRPTRCDDLNVTTGTISVGNVDGVCDVAIRLDGFEDDGYPRHLVNRYDVPCP